MQYYTFHINDYLGKTAHLDPIEDLAYRRLLDWYYQSEMPIPADIHAVAKRIRLRGYEAEIQAVLEEFFFYDEAAGVYLNERCQHDLAEIYAKSEKAREAASARWKKTAGKKAADDGAGLTDGTQEQNPVNQGGMRSQCVRNADAMRTQCGRNATQYPIHNTTTNNNSAREAPAVDNFKPAEAEPAVFAEAEPAETEFAMSRDWQPHQSDALAANLHMARLPAVGSDDYNLALLEFRSFWQTRPQSRFDAATWQHKFLQSMMSRRVNGMGGGKPLPALAEAAIGSTAVSAATPAPSRSRQALAVLEEEKQARLAGKDGALPARLFAELAAGLQTMLALGLKGRPPADSIAATLLTWEKTLAKGRVWDERLDKGRLAAAFESLSDTPDFPTPSDVLQRLPPRMTDQAALAYIPTPEEWKSKQEKAAEGLQTIRQTLGKRKTKPVKEAGHV